MKQPRQVTLDVDGDVAGVDPSDDALRAMLRAQTTSADSFFILEEAPQFYLQGVMHESGKFRLEYQEGDLERHYECEELLSLDKTVVVLSSYVRGDDAWRKACGWKKMKL